MDSREEFGHWEIDTVVDLRTGKDHALLTLTERKTRYEIIIKIDGKAADPVNRALKTLQEAAGKDFALLFKTITSDNGTEFSSISELFVGIDRKKWGSWNKNKRIFFFISWLVIAAILMSNNLYIFVLVSIILFFTELYL